jgi:hypothetical protein
MIAVKRYSMSLEIWALLSITIIFIIQLWAGNQIGVIMQSGKIKVIQIVQFLIKLDLLKWVNFGEDKVDCVKKLKDQLICLLLKIYS